MGEGSGISFSLFWLFLEGLRAAILKEEEEKVLNAVPEQDPFSTGKRQVGEQSAVRLQSFIIEPLFSKAY